MGTKVEWIEKSYEQLQDEKQSYAQTSGKKYAYPDDNAKWNMRYFGTWKEAVKFTRSINKNNEYYVKMEKEY